MTEKGLFGLGKNCIELEVDIRQLQHKIKQLQTKLKTIENGLVQTKSKKILGEFTTENIYTGVKRKLAKQYRITQSQIEDLNNQLTQVGNEKMWFDWIDQFSADIQSKKDVSDRKKKSILQQVLQNIIVEYDHEKKVHLLTINFKIPIVFNDDNGSKRLSSVAEVNVVPPRSGRKSTYPISNYSTVTLLAKLRGWSTLQPFNKAM